MTAARRVLILAPHPDDEIVACGIAAMRARAAGTRVFVYYLTTGVPEMAALWPRQQPGYAVRIERRRAEARQAACLLGLEPIDFCDTPSRLLRCHLDTAAAGISRAIAICAAEALWVPAFEGGHQDHDAANALAAGVAGRLPVWEFAAYNLAGGRIRTNAFATKEGSEIGIVANAAEAGRKRRALGCYRSERGNLRRIGVAHEAVRLLPIHDYSKPPHPGRLFRERFHWVPFRHPRIDFTPSADVQRDLGRWAFARASQGAAIGDRLERQAHGLA